MVAAQVRISTTARYPSECFCLIGAIRDGKPPRNRSPRAERVRSVSLFVCLANGCTRYRTAACPQDDRCCLPASIVHIATAAVCPPARQHDDSPRRPPACCSGMPCRSAQKAGGGYAKERAAGMSGPSMPTAAGRSSCSAYSKTCCPELQNSPDRPPFLQSVALQTQPRSALLCLPTLM